MGLLDPQCVRPASPYCVLQSDALSHTPHRPMTLAFAQKRGVTNPLGCCLQNAGLMEAAAIFLGSAAGSTCGARRPKKNLSVAEYKACTWRLARTVPSASDALNGAMDPLPANLFLGAYYLELGSNTYACPITGGCSPPIHTERNGDSCSPRRSAGRRAIQTVRHPNTLFSRGETICRCSIELWYRSRHVL